MNSLSSWIKIDQPPTSVGTKAVGKDNLVTEVGRLIFTDPEYATDDWEIAAIVYNFVDGRQNAFGYVFKHDGDWEARLPRTNGFDAIDKMVELNSEMHSRTGKKWLRALIHINRETAEMNIQFEYDDPTRWQIVPSKLEESVNALRP